MTATDATLDGLLAAICADPDSDDLRLVYADRMEELGLTHRAEFIRVQVEAAVIDAIEHTCRKEDGVWGGETECPSCGAYFRAVELLKLDNQLWQGHDEHGQQFADLWRGFDGFVLDNVPSPDEMTGVVRRGFVEAVTMSAAVWLRHADELTQAAPVREVKLTDIPLAGPAFRRADGVLFLKIAGEVVRLPVGQAEDGPGRTPLWWKGLLETRWPRIKFTLPATRTLSGSAGYITTSSGQTLPFDSWTLQGDPAAPQPQGVVSIEEQAAPTATPAQHCPGCWREHDEGRHSLCRSCRQEQRRRARGR